MEDVRFAARFLGCMLLLAVYEFPSAMTRAAYRRARRGLRNLAGI